jgi:SRSO17 transposase
VNLLLDHRLNDTTVSNSDRTFPLWLSGVTKVHGMVGSEFGRRLAVLRMRANHRDYGLREPHPQDWLSIGWPPGEEEPNKYWLSTLPDDSGLERRVPLAKLRQRIQRDCQELKQEPGLGYYEGRGLHPHASLCVTAYRFLIADWARLPLPKSPCRPDAQDARSFRERPTSRCSDSFGAAGAELDRRRARAAHRGVGPSLG